MATATSAAPRTAVPAVPGWPLAAFMLGLAGAAALLAGGLPIEFSIATVFLFAGPHNWFEARYMLGRLPARAGKLAGFFLFAFVGIVGLTASYAAFPGLARHADWDTSQWETGVAVWNSVLILWIAVLVHWRSQQNPRHDWGLAFPIAFAAVAGNWLAPYLFSLATVYLHPLMALWILDRELKRSRPTWRPAYHLCLAALPVLVGLIWWRLYDAPSLAGSDGLTERIAQHAGAGLLDVSSRLLVATHTFLEMVHYGVWVLVIPLIGLRSAPWRLQTVPVARRSPAWRWAVAGLLTIGLGVVGLLWACFVGDYLTTRDVYFTVAMLHVLAEVPFLLRAL